MKNEIQEAIDDILEQNGGYESVSSVELDLYLTEYGVDKTIEVKSKYIPILLKSLQSKAVDVDRIQGWLDAYDTFVREKGLISEFNDWRQLRKPETKQGDVREALEALDSGKFYNDKELRTKCLKTIRTALLQGQGCEQPNTVTETTLRVLSEGVQGE